MKKHKVLLEDMSWKEADEFLRQAEVTLIPTGAIEEHGPHLPLKHDIATSSYIAKAVAERLYPKVLVSVGLPIGYSPFHMGFKGTLTLEPSTMMALIYDMCKCLQRHGVKKIVVINGHGGNPPVLTLSVRKVRDELGMKITYLTYWDFIPTELAGKVLSYTQASGGIAGHAGEFETSTALYTHPELVRLNAVPKPEIGKEFFPELTIASSYVSPWGRLVIRDSHEVSKSGVCLNAGGDAGLATREKGEKLMEGAIKNLIAFLKFFMKD